MERIDRKREEVNIEEVAEFLKENLDKEIFCFIIKKVLPMYSNCTPLRIEFKEDRNTIYICHFD